MPSLPASMASASFASHETSNMNPEILIHRANMVAFRNGFWGGGLAKEKQKVLDNVHALDSLFPKRERGKGYIVPGDIQCF